MSRWKLKSGELHTMSTLTERSERAGKCLLWQGALDSGGTKPVIRVGNRPVSVRHYIFTDLLGNEVPEGHLVSFTCANHACIEPKHIKAMSRSELMTRAAALTQYGGSVGRKVKIAIKARARSPHTREDIDQVLAASGSCRQVARDLKKPLTFVTKVRMGRMVSVASALPRLATASAANDSKKKRRA